MEDQIDEQLNRAKSFLIFEESEAGKIMIEELERDVEDAVDKLVSIYKDASHVELSVIIARIESIKELIKELKGSKEKVEYLTSEKIPSKDLNEDA